MAFVASLPLFGGNAVQRTSRSTCRVRMELDEANKPLRRPPQPTAKPESGATWADEFLAPFPRKGVGSVVDYDLRPQSLQEGQPDQDDCDVCSGTGKVICSVCNGNHFFDENGVVTCKACKGARLVECSTCYGTGKAVELVENWYMKGISSLLEKVTK